MVEQRPNRKLLIGVGIVLLPITLPLWVAGWTGVALFYVGKYAVLGTAELHRAIFKRTR